MTALILSIPFMIIGTSIATIPVMVGIKADARRRRPAVAEQYNPT